MKALKSQRLHISVFGRTNVGKSSFLNGILGQEVSIVSEISGTTTDVVEKSAELFPIGAVTFLDTAGIDDVSDLAEKRIEKTFKVLNRTDIAVLVVTPEGFSKYELDLIKEFDNLEIPYIVVINKIDLSEISKNKLDEIKKHTENIIELSSTKTENITDMFVSALVDMVPEDFVKPPSILGDKLSSKDTVVLVTPIDKEAPKGRLILPQVQTIRDILDNNCVCVVTQQNNLSDVLNNLKQKPKLVVTDSQAFREVDSIVPDDIPLTSFSILFARLKGDLATFIKGASALDSLKPKDKVLVLESCTHHAIDDDIARVKIPALIEKKLGFRPVFEYKTGHDFPDITPYKLVIHCGACMTNRKEVLSRILISERLGVPITNYGVIISYCLGISERAVRIFN